MKQILLIPALVAALWSVPAQAACYADYKAKQDNPLRLHYGVIALPKKACAIEAAKAEIAGRIARDNWKLLTVLSIFDEFGLKERTEFAGQYYLRY